MAGLYLLFFLSGIAGLVYQVVWSRLLNEIFGVTVYAVTTVLATFLGGLALGSYVLGRAADRMRQPLAFYGWLEVGSGIAALAGTWIIGVLDPLHIAAANRFPPDSVTLIGARFLLGAIVILPPTFLMGGTLPAITRVFVDRIHRLGRELSLLYALNTLGAVAGTIVSGFILIRLVGIHPTLYMAVAINLLVGAIALFLALKRGLRRPLAQEEAALAKAVASAVDPADPDAVGSAPVRQQAGADSSAAAEPSAGSRSLGIGLLIVMAVCGFASLGLEVVWARLLILIVGTTTYAFVTMLASFLVGIAVGSFIARGIVDRVRDLRRMLGWIQIGIGLSALATIPILGEVGASLGTRWLGGSEPRWFALILSRFGVSFLIMLVPTTLIGMTFPVAGKLWAREVRSLGGHLGQVYGANTLGNIVGAGVTGFAILPALGLQKSVVFLAALSLANAAWALYPGAARGLIARLPRFAAVAAGLALLIGLVAWKPRPFTGTAPPDREYLFYDECIVATTMVFRDRNDPRKQSMAIDRIKIGDSYGEVDMKQQALAHFPFLLVSDHPLRRVLSIGLGTGILIGETAKHSEVESLDCLEIAPSVIAGARYFDNFNDHVLDNPRVRVICDDGVNFLRRTRTSYDAIISDEKSRTSHAGNALFYSTDYYALCRDRLADAGVMIQWVPMNVPPSELPVILRGFARVFPHAYVWVDPPAALYLVGMKRPLELDLDHIQTTMIQPDMANLQRYGWHDAYGFASTLTADRPAMLAWLGGQGTINSLEFPVLEFYSMRAFSVAEGRRVAENLTNFRRLHESRWSDVKVTRGEVDRLERYRRAVGEFSVAAERMQTAPPEAVADLLPALAQACDLAPDHGRLQFTASAEFFARAGELATRGDADRAIEALQKAVALRPDYAEAHFNLGNGLAARGRLQEATAHFQRVVQLLPDFPGGYFNLGNTLASQGHLAEAGACFQRTLALRPDFQPARQRLQQIQMMMQRQPPSQPS